MYKFAGNVNCRSRQFIPEAFDRGYGTAMAGKRRGRPPSAPETVRSHRVVTFVTESELIQLQRLAEHRQLALSGAVHQIIVAELQK